MPECNDCGTLLDVRTDRMSGLYITEYYCWYCDSIKNYHEHQTSV